MVEREDDALVLLVGGVGLRIHVPKGLLESAPLEAPLCLYTHLYVREDALVLYGFANRDERLIFMRLQSASGVGPKLALQVLGHFSEEELVKAIADEDVKKLSRVPGVGAKTASRIVLELKGSLDNWAALAGKKVVPSTATMTGAATGPLADIEAALLQLGFGEREVAPVLAELAPSAAAIGVNEGVRRALRALGR